MTVLSATSSPSPSTENDPIRSDHRRDRQYLAMGERYAEAATRLSRCGNIGGVREPFLMLVAHALELSLKAVLSHQGHDEERLMAIGHSLERCHRQAVKGGFHPKDRTGLAILVEALDQPHAFQAFRYPQILGWTLPDAARVVAPMVDHLEAVKLLLDTTDRPSRE